MNHVLLATIGQRPEAITMALDVLLPRFVYEKIVLLHTEPNVSGIAQSLHNLTQELGTYPPYENLQIICQAMTLKNGQAIIDVDTQKNVEGYFHALVEHFAYYRKNGYCVHVLISGGRKAMSAYAVVAASFVLSYHDRIWTSIVPQDLMKPHLWHAPGGRAHDVKVVTMPFRASQLTYNQLDDIQFKTLVFDENYDMRESFKSNLTPKQLEVVQMIKDHPYDTDGRIASLMNITQKTFENHLSQIYEKLSEFFVIPASNKRAFLINIMEGRF